MLNKSFSELIIPYLWAILVCLGMRLIMAWPVGGSMELRLADIGTRFRGFLLGLPAEKELFGHHIWATGALWFILALFIAENILNLILKIKNRWLQYLSVAMCIMAGFLLYRVDFNYYCIPQGLHAVAYCYLGYLLKKHKLVERGLYSKWVYIILGTFVAAQVGWTAYSGQWFGMSGGDYNIIIYLAAGISGVFMLFAGVYCDRFEWKWLELFRKIGTYSYWVIIIHSIETLSFPWYEIEKENPSSLLAFAIEVAMKIIIIMTGCMICKKLSQSKYKRKVVKHGEEKLHR